MFDNFFVQWGATQTAFTIGGFLVGSVACVAVSATPLFSGARLAQTRRARVDAVVAERGDGERS